MSLLIWAPSVKTRVFVSTLRLPASPCANVVLPIPVNWAKTPAPEIRIESAVVSNFIVQALQNEDITIYGDGSQTRSFCYVDDLIEGFIRLMDTDDGFTGPMNIGNPNEFTMIELANKVIELTGSKSQLVNGPLPNDDPTQRQPDISLASQILNWKP